MCGFYVVRYMFVYMVFISILIQKKQYQDKKHVQNI